LRFALGVVQEDVDSELTAHALEVADDDVLVAMIGKIGGQNDGKKVLYDRLADFVDVAPELTERSRHRRQNAGAVGRRQTQHVALRHVGSPARCWATGSQCTINGERSNEFRLDAGEIFKM